MGCHPQSTNSQHELEWNMAIIELLIVALVIVDSEISQFLLEELPCQQCKNVLANS